AASSPINGRLPLSRSPPQPNTQYNLPLHDDFSVDNTFSSASGVWAKSTTIRGCLFPPNTSIRPGIPLQPDKHLIASGNGWSSKHNDERHASRLLALNLPDNPEFRFPVPHGVYTLMMILPDTSGRISPYAIW